MSCESRAVETDESKVTATNDSHGLLDKALENSCAIGSQQDCCETQQKSFKETAGLKTLSVDDLVPETFSSGRRVRIGDIIDRSVGSCIGIKRMTCKGLTGYPEIIPTHVYICFKHFFELQKLLEDIAKLPPATTKWIKFVKCHYELDMYQRPHIHKDVYSKDCFHCRNYLEKLIDKSIWWYRIGNGYFIRVTFKDFWNDNTFQCSNFSIRRFGMVEIQLKMESTSDGENIRRCFPVQTNNTKLVSLQSPIEDVIDPVSCSGQMDLPNSISDGGTCYDRTEDNHQPLLLMDEKSRMMITTKHLLTFFRNRWPLHIETTYKLIEQRAVLVIGTTDFGGRFTLVGFAITINEDIDDYEFVFRSIKENTAFDYMPEKLVSIPIPAIKIAAQEVFGSTIVIYTCSFFLQMSIYNWISENGYINVEDRRKIMADLKIVKRAPPDHAIEAFISKWNKYPDFLEYFEGKWIIENPNWCHGISNNGLQSVMRSMKGLDSVQNIEQYVQNVSKTFV